MSIHVHLFTKINKWFNYVKYISIQFSLLINIFQFNNLSWKYVSMIIIHTVNEIALIAINQNLKSSLNNINY